MNLIETGIKLYVHTLCNIRSLTCEKQFNSIIAAYAECNVSFDGQIESVAEIHMNTEVKL